MFLDTCFALFSFPRVFVWFLHCFQHIFYSFNIVIILRSMCTHNAYHATSHDIESCDSLIVQGGFNIKSRHLLTQVFLQRDHRYCVFLLNLLHEAIQHVFNVCTRGSPFALTV